MHKSGMERRLLTLDMCLATIAACAAFLFPLGAAYAESPDMFFKDGLEPRPCRVNPVLQDSVRQRVSLDGLWDFIADPDQRGEQERWYLPDREYPDRLWVPGSWNAQGIGGPGELDYFWGIPVSVPGAYTGQAWYRRQVSVPASWQGKIVWLKIGGAMPNVRIWVNGEFVGARFADGLSFAYEITRHIRPGSDNTIAIAIDNRLEMVAMTRHMNLWGSWGGLFRSVILEAVSPTHIANVFIIPSIGPRRATIQLKILHPGVSDSFADLLVDAQQEGGGASYRMSERLILRPGENEAQVRLDMPGAKLWTLESPFLYHLSVKLSLDGRVADEWRERFGLRTLSVSGNRALLNGKPFFITGVAYDGYFPPDLTPPVNREDYRRALHTIKSYGFNYLRVPWLPPLEFIEAADEVGILLQLELEEANRNFPEYDESILKLMLLEVAFEYRNHPAFATYDMSNEHWLGAPHLTRLCDLIRSIDSTRWAIDSDGVRGEPRISADLWLGFDQFWTYDDPNSPVYAIKPVVHHEFLNIPTLPNLESKSRYTGALQCPAFLKRLEAWLRERNLLGRYPQLLKSSYRVQRIYAKAGIEAVRRNPGPQGYSWLEGIDVDQINVWSGVMTSFYAPKAWQPDELRPLNSQSVLLVRQVGASYYKQGDSTPGGSATHYYGEPLSLSFLVSHYGESVADAQLSWQLTSNGQVVQSGRLLGLTVPAYTVSELGQVEVNVAGFPEARNLVLSAQLRAPQLALDNSWDFWFFPKGERLTSSPVPIAASGGVAAALKSRYPFIQDWTSRSPLPGVLVTDSLSDAYECLDQGGRVLLLSLKDLGMELRAPGYYPGWWINIPDRSLGIVLEQHAAFGRFPHTGVADWQVSRLVNEAVSAPADAFSDTASLEPLAYGLTLLCTYAEGVHVKDPDLLLHVFQARVGSGRLLACGFSLLQEPEPLPEAGYLLDQLIRYVISDQFAPKAQLRLRI